MCLTASQAPSLGQLVGSQLTEGMAGPGFLFLLLSVACHLLVGREKLGLSCDALGGPLGPVPGGSLANW